MTEVSGKSSPCVDNSLHKDLQSFLTAHGLFSPGQKAHFLVAYSGGQDSTALLYALYQLKLADWDSLKITAAYYAHPWRPLQEDFQVIHQNCKRLGVSWLMLMPDLTLPKTETAARRDRYQQLARLCRDLNASAVLTGHHQDDQVETILFRLFRGTGLDGLTGIPELRDLFVEGNGSVPLVRPFLAHPRAALETYVKDHQLAFVTDPTNGDTQFKRNWIRQSLLPQIESTFPQVRTSLLKLSELTQGDLDMIDTRVDRVWQEVFDAKTRSLDEIRLTQLALPYQRRLLRRFLQSQGQEAGYSKIEDVLAFITGEHRPLNKPGLFSLGPQTFLTLYRNRIRVEHPMKHDIQPIPLTIPGEICHTRMKACVSISPLTLEQRLKPIDFTRLPKNEVYADLSGLGDKPLTLRTRQKGDRIQPLGMAQAIKLKRFLINREIPRFHRDSIPLLTLDSQVLWVVGIGISEMIRVKERPTHRIILTQPGDAIS